jgi:short-subunit dehydrogenase
MAKWAIVTGASSGIGLELSRLLARGGYDLVAVAQREPQLHQLKIELRRRWQTNVKTLSADLSRQTAAEKVWKFTQRHKIEPDILVNNAGFGDLAEFTNSDWDKQQRMLNLNVVSPTYLCRLYAPGMAMRGHGRILNVASNAAFLPGPMMSVYHASKWYVTAFSRSLREELRGTGATVTVLFPGPTATGFQRQANQQSVKVFARPEKMARAYGVAQAGYDAMMDGRASSVPGLTPKITLLAGRLLPNIWLAWAVNKIYGRRTKQPV